MTTNNEGKRAQLAMVRSMTNSVASGDLRRVKKTIKVLEAEGFNQPWTIDYFTLTQQAQKLADNAALAGEPYQQRSYEDIAMFLSDKHRGHMLNRVEHMHKTSEGSREHMPKMIGRGLRRSRSKGRAHGRRSRSRRASRHSSR